MARNKILGWMTAFQGIKHIAGIAMYSLRKTTIDALKAMASNKAIFKVPKEVQSNAKDMGLEAISRNPEATKNTKVQPKMDWTFGGFLIKSLLRKPRSKW